MRKTFPETHKGLKEVPEGPDIAHFGIHDGNMTNDGSWSATVENFCIGGGSVDGANPGDFNDDVINNDTPAACNAVNAISCDNCPASTCDLMVTVTQVDPVTCNNGQPNNDGSAIANSTGGNSCGNNSSLSYEWNTNPVQTTQTAINLAPGTYTVTVTDPSGCTGTASITIPPPGPCCGGSPPTCTISGLTTVCPGSSNQYCGPAGLDGYNWTISGNGTIVGSDTSQCVTIEAGPDCNTTYTLMLETEEDTCMAMCSAIVQVKDEVPPSITCSPVVSPVECPAMLGVFDPPTVSDNCDQDLTVTHSDVNTMGDCLQEFTVTRTWTVTDDCGNTATCSRTVSVEDNTPPTISCAPVMSPTECPEEAWFDPPTVMDACDMMPTIIFSEDVVPGNCAGEMLVTRTWDGDR